MKARAQTSGMIRVPCGSCGSELLKYPSELSGKKYGAFCDRNCLGKYRSKKLTGAWAANYKTGSCFDRKYIEVEARWHPRKNRRGYVYLHRIIAEAKLGRLLNENEIVHHLDHDARNNHWENLEVTTQSSHAKKHNSDRKRNKHGQFQN